MFYKTYVYLCKTYFLEIAVVFHFQCDGQLLITVNSSNYCFIFVAVLKKFDTHMDNALSTISDIFGLIS